MLLKLIRIILNLLAERFKRTHKFVRIRQLVQHRPHHLTIQF